MSGSEPPHAASPRNDHGLTRRLCSSETRGLPKPVRDGQQPLMSRSPGRTANVALRTKYAVALADGITPTSSWSQSWVSLRLCSTEIGLEDV
jgi:hypothetical protein